VTCNENGNVTSNENVENALLRGDSWHSDSWHSFHQIQRRILRERYEDVSSREGSRSRCHTQSPLPEEVTDKTQERVMNASMLEVRVSLSLFRVRV
jgi:hypothetical protein